MKKLVIAEKPSVGKEIAKTLGSRIREEGYMEGPLYVVTWALGHLVELAEPAKYSERYKRWSLKDLPMLPEVLEEEVIEETKPQFEIIKRLLERPDISSVVIATDAGREGELVARWILKLASSSKPCERLWISSQTEKAILEGFSSLRPSSDYDNLYRAAECRAAADWYVGMNVTRALTCFYDAKLSAGRVQTPTLALMTKREDEIDEFLGSFYYTARGDFGLFAASYYPEENTIRFTREEKKAELENLTDVKGRVISLVTEEKEDPVPQAYDLTELQRDANIALGFSAKETLDTLQRLYEVHKIVTYPRTDSRYITTDIVPTLRERIEAIRESVFSYQADEYLNSGFVSDNPRFVNDALVSDHHAIIPTETKVDLSRLSLDEEKLWRLIALRFLEVLGESYKYKSTNAKIEVNGNIFKTRLTVPVRKGYRSVSESAGLKSSAPALDEGESAFALRMLKEGDEVELKSVKIRKSSTIPPERYTDATLLSAMENAGRFVDDKEIKGNLQNGLGTPATRADMIEKLVQNHYVERDGKYLVPTAKGREVVRLSPLVLQSAELTGIWEGRLEQISKGKEDPEIFIRDIKKMAGELVSEVEKSTLTFSPSFKDTKKCPYCGKDMMKSTESDGTVHYICQSLSCQYEEKIVRIKVDTAPYVKRVTSTDGKAKIVIKKTAGIPKAVYETKTVVVNQSKRNYRRDTNGSEPMRKTSYNTFSSSGGTMADFFLKSQKKAEERKNRKKK
ncbi:MAG TPA: DNA topoisomerase 3 [Candidatus Ornithospirochaeta avicola]|uniref:DNA topoisomerase n=1 Tax=Candidatus Ornithospirochaeta avicola TaxID=2840896 RepID=A0A9D1PTW6_9SPIO|nr:DNA topoisomerase 3 [Candidatus Ornithospirochaeta avicola]